MAHTYTDLLVHIIFSTKDRQPSLNEELRRETHAYIGGIIIREINGKAVAIGGIADHVHILAWMPPTLSISDTLRIVKTNSSRWLNDKGNQKFAWQIGYGAFSVSHSNLSTVANYIERQEEHHRKMTFQDEYLLFLKRHNVDYDKRYVFD